nr:ATP-binding protein [Planktothrix sp. FACHB-1355]
MGNDNRCTAEGFMLRDLTIQNYRCFKDFHIDGLARVNLIVGSNNSGKTSLLEAVYLLVNQVNLEPLINFLYNRGEIADYSISQSSFVRGEIERRSGYEIRHIFYGHQLNTEQTISVRSEKEAPLSVQFQIKEPERIQKPPGFDLFLTPEGGSIEPSKFLLLFSDGRGTTMPIPIRDDGLITGKAFRQWNEHQPHAFVTTSNSRLFTQNISSNFFLTTTNINFQQMAVFWDKITLTPKEESVVAALQILEPNIERISFTSRQSSSSGVLLKLHGQHNPINLGSMGEGMRRMLSLAMAAVTVENGLLLVDEIETGLYYEAQTDMWRLIFSTAKRLNLQVFATTHSWDCIAGFQEALAEFEDNSVGKLFRLSRRDEKIRAVEYTADELAVAVRQSIEVR